MAKDLFLSQLKAITSFLLYLLCPICCLSFYSDQGSLLIYLAHEGNTTNPSITLSYHRLFCHSFSVLKFISQVVQLENNQKISLSYSSSIFRRPCKWPFSSALASPESVWTARKHSERTQILAVDHSAQSMLARYQELVCSYFNEQVLFEN